MNVEILPENKYQFQEQNPSGEQTMLLIGGITEGIKTEEPFAGALAAEGFRVVSFDYVHGAMSKDEGPSMGRHHEAKVQQTTAILDMIVSEGQHTTLFGHSQGAPIAVEAALRNPDKVERLILANPAGLFADSFPRLAGRFAVETLRKTFTMKDTAQNQQVQGVKRMARHPRDFIGDAVDIAHADIVTKLKQLQEKGIKVDLLMSAKDQVFPWRLQEGYFEGQNIEKFDFNSVSSYFNTKDNGKQHRLASKWAGHDQNIVYPKQTAHLVKQLLGL